MAVARFVSLVTIAVAGPFPGDTWRWEIDGPGGIDHGYGSSFADARAAAAIAAPAVLGRLEAPLGGHTLADAIAGPTPPRVLP